VPTLLLNARNDPFLPAAALPGTGDVSTAVRLEFPDEGGHAAFVGAPFPGNIDWMPRRITAFFEEAMAAREAGSHARANGIIPHRGTLRMNLPPRRSSRPTTYAASSANRSPSKACGSSAKRSAASFSIATPGVDRRKSPSAGTAGSPAPSSPGP